MAAVRVAGLAELAPDRPTLVEAEGVAIVLTRLKDGVYACGATCAHQGGPLAAGTLTGTRLVCPWHGWRYDVRTGACVMPVRGGPVDRYPVRVEGEDVWVELP